MSRLRRNTRFASIGDRKVRMVRTLVVSIIRYSTNTTFISAGLVSSFRVNNNIVASD